MYSLPWSTSLVDGAAPIAGTEPIDASDYLGAMPVSAEGTSDGFFDANLVQNAFRQK